MSGYRSRVGWFIVSLCAIVLFVYKLHPVVTFDTFFGLAIGEHVLTTGQIPTREVFSWSAQGRPIVAYEWLAQTVVALLYRLGQFLALEIYVSAMLSIFFLITFITLRKTFEHNFTTSLLLSLFLAVSVYEFFVARPQTIAFVCLIGILSIIFQTIRSKTRLIWLTLPITYIWTNSHASFILSPILMFSYALFGYLYWIALRQTNRAWVVARLLFVWGLLTTLMTILPPLWHTPYLLLWDFTRDIAFITQFVSEWGPIGQNPTYQIFYLIVFTMTSVIALGVTLGASAREKAQLYGRWWLAAPLILGSIASFQAIRHVPIGTISLVLFAGLFTPNLDINRYKWTTSILTIVFLSFTVHLATQKRAPVFDTLWAFPNPGIDREVQVIKSLHLQGHMFNDFAVGGYLTHALYPSYQVFFDGRADIYHNHEMRDFWPLVVKKKTSHDEFKAAVDTFLNTYQFSYMIIPLYSYNPLLHTATSRMADLLLDDPNWRLIFASDHVEVILRNDGKNTELFQKYGMVAATPYRLNPYKKDQRDRAAFEYARLGSIAESGVARSALGEIALEKKEYTNARESFEKALGRNPRLGKPLVGLAKLALVENNEKDAISLLEAATTREPYLGEAYLLLVQSYAHIGQRQKARASAERGLAQDIDLLSRQKLVQALSQLNP